jgi:hypothetical protein
LAFISASSQTRQNSLGFASGNAQVTRALAQIEQEQVIEFSLANNLTGASAHDLPLLNQLNTSLQKAMQESKSLAALVSFKFNTESYTNYSDWR